MEIPLEDIDLKEQQEKENPSRPQRNFTADQEQELYRAVVGMLLTPDQIKKEVWIKGISDQLRLLNARKEELYFKDDMKEFGSMSPVKKLAHKGLQPNYHQQDIEGSGQKCEFPSLSMDIIENSANKLKLPKEALVAASVDGGPPGNGELGGHHSQQRSGFAST